MKKNEENFKNDEERLETPYEVFKRNYDTVPGFKELVKLSIYVILFLTLAITMIVTVSSNKGKRHNSTKTTTTESSVVRYQDILDKLLDNTEYSCKIKVNDNNYLIDASFGNNILVGTIDSKDGTSRFSIRNNEVYELKLDSETINEELLNNINKNIIVNSSLIDILKNNSGVKLDNAYKYTKVSIDDVLYDINVIVDNNKVISIELLNDNISYIFVYK